MPLTFKTNGGGADFKVCPAGSHIAVCDMVIDLGLQPGSGQYPAPKHQVYIRFEIPAERIDYEKDGKKLSGPAVLGMTFTASMHEKANLRKQLESWRGKRFSDEEAERFEVDSVLGKGCMISVVHTTKGEKTYANIQSISGMPRGLKSPDAELGTVFFTENDQRDWEKLPKWLQDKLNSQLTKKPPLAPARAPDPDSGDPGITDADLPDFLQDDDIPF